MDVISSKIMINRIWKDIKRIRIALLILFVYGVVTQLYFHTVCPFKILTGFPCPGCGLTRASIMIITLQFEKAFRYNAMAFLWIILILYAVIMRYVCGKRIKCGLFLVITVSLLTIIYYVYRIKMQFPTDEVLRYSPKNIINLLNNYCI